jgi:hypothetical protein
MSFCFCLSKTAQHLLHDRGVGQSCNKSVQNNWVEKNGQLFPLF